MPLVRAREQFGYERFEGVYFWMRDGASHVLCKVSHAALRDRSASDGENPAMRIRSSVTACASRRSPARSTTRPPGERCAFRR